MSHARPLKTLSKIRCLFCRSTKCHTRIVTQNLGFDEIACRKHGRDLELYADATLGTPGRSAARWHLSGTATYQRGDVVPDRQEFDAEIAHLKETSTL